MSNRILAITGPTSGIGKSTVIELASEYDILILLCRNVDKGESVNQLIQARHPFKRVIINTCYLSYLSCVMQAITIISYRYTHVDCLINNAGVVSLTTQKTVDGYELMFGTNYLGHLLLPRTLFEKIMESEDKQIIVVSSGAYKYTAMGNHNFAYPLKFNPVKSYSKSKLAV